MQPATGAATARDSQAAASEPAPGAATDRQALLTVRNLVKSFGGVAAVDGMSFELGVGEILGLVGPNGAGKTTLFDCLAGSLAPTSGSIHLQGRPIDAVPAHRRLAIGLGRTFQIPRPFGEMTLLENVVLGAQRQSGERILPNWLRPRGVAREERRAREKAMELLDFMTLAKLADAKAKTLSGGQRKLLELARVLMAEPSIILLDEPAAGVNPSLMELIIDRLVALNRQGTTLLVIEHNMDLVTRLCGRVIVMANGRLLASGPPSFLWRDARVVQAYLGGAPA
jgi:branched-chain amino acid transport system ATP-binding protein